MLQPWDCYVGGGAVLAKFLLPSQFYPNLYFFLSFCNFSLGRLNALVFSWVTTLQVVPDCGQEGLGQVHWLCDSTEVYLPVTRYAHARDCT